MSKTSVSDAKRKAMLRELGKVRRQEARRTLRQRRRAQMRLRAGQVLNAAIYILVSGIVATVLLSL